MLDQRGQLLRAAVGFAGCSMPSYDCALHALRMWLDSWAGIGHVAVGMHRQGFDLQLTQYDERGWRATFYTTGMGTQSRVPLEMIALSGVRSSCDMLARNSDLWLLRGQTRSPPRKRSRGRAKRRFAPARNVSSPGAPQLPVGDYTVRARLIYDLNRYSDPEHTGSQTEIYRAFLAIRVAN